LSRQSTRQNLGKTANGDRLRDLMAARDMSIEEVAFKLHVSASTVGRWLRSEVAPTRSAGVALAGLFGVERAEFYTDLKEAA
jgi:transcriptional regulator with XRE-family HTH domain